MTWKPMIERSTSTDTLLVSVEDDETDTMICECYYGTDQERIEYANLIAAAPDLLAAIKAAAEWGAPFKDAPRGSRPDWFGLANAAIRKATGGAA